jgi:predicted translin family RNA/ssDNA-binding protein
MKVRDKSGKFHERAILKNIKKMLRQIKENLNKWRNILHLWLKKTQCCEEINSLRFYLWIKHNPNQNHKRIFVKINKLIKNSHGNSKDLGYSNQH